MMADFIMGIVLMILWIFPVSIFIPEGGTFRNEIYMGGCILIAMLITRADK